VVAKDLFVWVLRLWRIVIICFNYASRNSPCYLPSIDSAAGREFESEVPAAEEMLEGVVVGGAIA